MTPSFRNDFRLLWKHSFPDVQWPGELPALVYLFNKLGELRAQVEPHADLPMRTQAEIVHAHDTVANLILNRDFAPEISSHVWEELAVRAEVLCWVLRHDHNVAFSMCLEQLRVLLAGNHIVQGKVQR